MSPYHTPSQPIAAPAAVDVHQHAWPESVIDLLACRTETPCVTRAHPHAKLHLAGEQPYDHDEALHSLARRAADMERAGIDRALLAPPCALGIEWLPGADARPFLAAWHRWALELEEPFGWWGWSHAHAPDHAHVLEQLADGACGIVLPAATFTSRERLARVMPVLDLLESARRPLLLHPGTPPDQVTSAAIAPTAWWPAMTTYVTQMYEATIALHTLVRPRLPALQVVLPLLGGLAPLHASRAALRGAPTASWFDDPDTFYECASYDAATVEAIAAIVGAEQVLFGSDAPVLDLATLPPAASLECNVDARGLATCASTADHHDHDHTHPEAVA